MASCRFTDFVIRMRTYKNAGSDDGEPPQQEIFNILQDEIVFSASPGPYH